MHLSGSGSRSRSRSSSNDDWSSGASSSSNSYSVVFSEVPDGLTEEETQEIWSRRDEYYQERAERRNNKENIMDGTNRGTAQSNSYYNNAADEADSSSSSYDTSGSQGLAEEEIGQSATTLPRFPGLAQLRDSMRRMITRRRDLEQVVRRQHEVLSQTQTHQHAQQQLEGSNGGELAESQHDTQSSQANQSIGTPAQSRLEQESLLNELNSRLAQTEASIRQLRSQINWVISNPVTNSRSNESDGNNDSAEVRQLDESSQLRRAHSDHQIVEEQMRRRHSQADLANSSQESESI